MGYPAFNLTVEQLSDVQNVEVAGLNSAAKADLARWRAMPQELQMGLLEQMQDYLPAVNNQLDGPCSWLDPVTRLCIHHPHRPQVCRDFQVGGAGCLQWRHAAAGSLQSGC
jgi:Fe-S-cluster containining protein